MKLEVRQFLVVDDKRLLSKGKFKYSGSTSIFPINQDIPVIVKGKGCVGITRIDSLYIDESGTTVEYGDIARVDEATGKALYNLYRASVGTKAAANKSSNDMEDYEDQVIPGLFRPSRGVRFE